MRALINKIKAFIADEQGAETVEYIVIAAIMVAIALAVYNISLQKALSDAVADVASKIAPPPAG